MRTLLAALAFAALSGSLVHAEGGDGKNKTYFYRSRTGDAGAAAGAQGGPQAFRYSGKVDLGAGGEVLFRDGLVLRGKLSNAEFSKGQLAALNGLIEDEIGDAPAEARTAEFRTWLRNRIQARLGEPRHHLQGHVQQGGPPPGMSIDEPGTEKIKKAPANARIDGSGSNEPGPGGITIDEAGTGGKRKPTTGQAGIAIDEAGTPKPKKPK